MKTALFPGSFDPITLGHVEIVERSLGLFDRIVIGVGLNSMKKFHFSPEQRIAMIEKVFEGNPAVVAKTYEGLTTDFAKTIGAQFLLRGIRSAADLEFERPVATINREVLSGIETVFLISSGKTSHISSTIVRELIRHQAKLDGLVPQSVISMVYPPIS